MQGTAYALIRSVVANPDDRQKFDHWYETDHFPLVFSKVDNLLRGWRFWSRTDPAVHYSVGEFATMSELQRAVASDGFKHIVGDYDRTWGSAVTRTRDFIEKVQYFRR
jgi:hypothetical protein